MIVHQSSIGRLMLAILTVAVGFETLKTQSDFLLGCLTTLTAGWLMLALVCATGPDDRQRKPWIAFLIATSIGLFLGFGPWSDAPSRARLFESGYILKHEDELWPSTIAFVRLSHHLKPRDRAWIVARDPDARSGAEMVMTGDRGGPMNVEITAENLMLPSVRNEPSVLQSGSSVPLRSMARTLDVYLDACYLMGCLAVGSMARLSTVVVKRFRRSPIRNDGSADLSARG